MRGKLFDLSRFCLDDGPGIRTTVFFKGCPLHCGWCHNPEGKSGKIQILYNEKKCVRCGACITVCPTGSRTEKGIQRNLCKGCGKCASVCKHGALRLAGYETDAERIVEICVQDKIYYQKSGGGVTLSGGEVLKQPKFAAELLKKLKEQGISTCIETSGWNAAENLLPLLPYLDLVFLDYKTGNEADLKKYTGLLAEDVEQAAELLEKEKIPVWLRRPMIRGINDSEEELEKLIRFVKKHPGIERIQLLPYHSMGVSKAGQMGEEQQKYQKPLDAVIEHWEKKAGKESGVPAEVL